MFAAAVKALKNSFESDNNIKPVNLSILVSWIEQMTSFAVTNKRKAQIQLLLSVLHEKHRDFNASLRHAKNTTAIVGSAENWSRYCQVLLCCHYQIDLTQSEGQQPSESGRKLLQKAVQDLAHAENFTFAHIVCLFIGRWHLKCDY